MCVHTGLLLLKMFYKCEVNSSKTMLSFGFEKKLLCDKIKPKVNSSLQNKSMMPIANKFLYQCVEATGNTINFIKSEER
jgi:hypothetical protein